MLTLEDIKTIKEAEKKATEIHAGAVSEAKQLITDAERRGREYMARARADAEAKVRKILEEAEAEASRRSTLARADAQKCCDALRSAADSRLDKAAEKIVERIVSA
jgi:V/A-type H+-transporting ATPase subunit G/H